MMRKIIQDHFPNLTEIPMKKVQKKEQYLKELMRRNLEILHKKVLQDQVLLKEVHIQHKEIIKLETVQ